MLSKPHAAAIRRHVEGNVVHDFGAGNFALSVRLLELGASQVIAVDKSPAQPPPLAGLSFVRSRFEDYRESSDIAFISWPINHPVGLHRLIEHSRLVIYLGKNTDGTVCGYDALWDHLVQREALDHLPTFMQTLIVYGPRRVRRPQLPEEFAALNLDHVWSYRELNH
jgi:hypothetical protein